MFAFLKRLFGPDPRETTPDFQMFSKDEKHRRSKRTLKAMLLEYMNRFKKSPFMRDKHGKEAKKFWKECQPSPST